ncbi:MAG: hypothetical protein H6983_01795 [Ectothiorhodospiraceae bacterium]|nr:hypothetical protein [Ectothiorhodospiraceae bacterium]
MLPYRRFTVSTPLQPEQATVRLHRAVRDGNDIGGWVQLESFRITPGRRAHGALSRLNPYHPVARGRIEPDRDAGVRVDVRLGARPLRIGIAVATACALAALLASDARTMVVAGVVVLALHCALWRYGFLPLAAHTESTLRGLLGVAASSPLTPNGSARQPPRAAHA